MEDTLGKRIVANRKRLGLTQDALAELLGVTAQAVSKWENDQSCPDIATLPRLAEIFGISTDGLLGMEKKTVHEAEIVQDGPDDEDAVVHMENGNWEMYWDSGRKGSIALAVWVLLVGGIMLASSLLHFNAGLWDVLWPSALLVYGLFGLLPRFSFFRLGCSLFGLYFLLSNLNFAPFSLGKGILLPVLLLLFGGSLLVDALRKPKKNGVVINRSGKGSTAKNHCQYSDNRFDCATAFGENHYFLPLTQLSGGTAEVSFGEMHVDLQVCEHVSQDCTIDLHCSFGELELTVPRRFRVEPANSTAFASVKITGAPSSETTGVIRVSCDVNFGEISIRYV